MIRVILVAPEIPPNTGNIIRLAANTGAELHLVRPLGFRLDDREMKRAGMDYRERAAFQVHDDFPAALAAAGNNRAFAFSAAGKTPHNQPRYQPDDILVFGCESCRAAAGDSLPISTRTNFANPDAPRQPQFKSFQRRRRRRDGGRGGNSDSPARNKLTTSSPAAPAPDTKRPSGASARACLKYIRDCLPPSPGRRE